MAVVTVADVLRHAEAFEKRLADYYADVSERATKEGVRLLCGYMSRHQSRIAEYLDKLPGDRVRRIMSTPIRYQPQAADCRCFEGMDLPAEATAAEVLDTAVKFDECLILLYRQVLRQDVNADMKDLFEGLIRVEELDEVELSKIKSSDCF